MRAITTLGLAILVTLALGSCASPTPTAAPGSPASHQEMARHYAPVIRQGVASDQDFITAVDFDGDWVGNNNPSTTLHFDRLSTSDGAQDKAQDTAGRTSPRATSRPTSTIR